MYEPVVGKSGSTSEKGVSVAYALDQIRLPRGWDRTPLGGHLDADGGVLAQIARLLQFAAPDQHEVLDVAPPCKGNINAI